jgi:hypothetical protein
MAKQYRIHIRGRQREQIDADLMAQLVVTLGRQLAAEAAEAAEAERKDAAAQDGRREERTA